MLPNTINPPINSAGAGLVSQIKNYLSFFLPILNCSFTGIPLIDIWRWCSAREDNAVLEVAGLNRARIADENIVVRVHKFPPVKSVKSTFQFVYVLYVHVWGCVPLFWCKSRKFAARTFKPTIFSLIIFSSVVTLGIPQTNRIWPGLTEFGPPMWQTEADTELTLSALPATIVGQILLTLAKLC